MAYGWDNEELDDEKPSGPIAHSELPAEIPGFLPTVSAQVAVVPPSDNELAHEAEANADLTGKIRAEGDENVTTGVDLVEVIDEDDNANSFQHL